MPYLVLEKFGQAKPMPSNSTKVMKWRRYTSLDNTPTSLTEGVTPASQTLNFTDVTATLVQYGGLVTISDIIEDTHEDPVLQEATALLGEQAAQLIEKMRFGILKAGVNVVYANGASRSAVNTIITLSTQRRAVRALKRQNGRAITSIVRSTTAYGTENITPSFIGLIHPDVESDVRNLVGFTPSEKYGTISPWENEIGKVEEVRYLSSTIFEPFLGSASVGGAAGSMLTSNGANADVYPVLFLSANAYGIVALKGMFAVTPMVVNPTPSDSDPLAQRGHASWKALQTAVILNDAWMVRAEVAATA